ncbi:MULTISPECIES: inactive transglutaminase family protein [unclassified Marinimicrobium]|uniref:inactive transglutaminase family protein n=1 Tax=unclassified Marinimicrobium TaxID=2632100 RepID=UPI000C54B876|nr:MULTISPECIES: inactive transglutaminase family protein [unclassified Marinimicrobium]MAN52187.1 gonadoliberin III [Marinimicrobium sp.]
MTQSRVPFYLIVVSLVVAGLATAWARHVEMELPFWPGEQRPVWLVEARVDFQATGGEVLVSLDLPDNPPDFRLHTEHATSPGYGFSIIEEGGDRRGEWSKREARGPQTLYYKAQLIGGVSEVGPQPSPDDEQQAPKPRSLYWEEPQDTAANQLLSQALETSSTPESLTRELIKRLNNPTGDQNASLLIEEVGSRSLLLERLLNQADIPARQVMGLFLEDARRRQTLTPMVEAYNGEEWVLFNPQTGEQGVPENLVLWHRGGASLLDVTGGRNSGVSFSMIRQTVPAEELAVAQFSDSAFALLGVQQLPIEEQSMFKMLFLLPLGALVVVFMRIIVGLKTSGTFMPVLISLAFLQTSLLPGLISFVVVVSLGLMLRSYLSHLNLLLVARIATLVVLVIFLISMLSLLGYQLGFSTGMTITFFPMIIIAWTIERMSILWEEEGAHEVVIQGGGSLLVAVMAYLLMQLPLANHLSFNFPELNLVILALIMLMGQYTGYKLSELRRFRAMALEQEAAAGSDKP